MKVLELIRFELAYQARRPVNYLYFFALTFIAFLFSRLGIKGIAEVSVQVKENAPLIIHQLTALLNLPLLLIASAVMGTLVIRDFDKGISPLLFTSPINRRQYLAGRFVGGILVLIIISFGSLLGAMAGEFFANKPAQEMLPFQPWVYLNAFITITLPNLFFVSGLYFAGGSLSKKATVVYTQGILLVMIISFLDEGVIETARNLKLATLFDFYTLQLVNLETKYWSAAEINTQNIPVSASLLINRSIYLGIGVLMLVLTFFRFQTTLPTSKKNK